MGYGLLIILYGWKSPIQKGGGVWFFTNKLALEEWSFFLPGLPEWQGAAILDSSFQQGLFSALATWEQSVSYLREG